MAAYSHCRGWPIVYKDAWRYVDTGETVKDSRPCPRCSRFPTKEGNDVCLGYIPGAVSVCCGHGVEDPWIQMQGEDVVGVLDRKRIKWKVV